MLNIALIGVGYISQNHIAGYRTRKDAAVTAVICRHADHGNKAAKEIGGACRYYPTLEEALKGGKIDVVDICTPSSLHEQYTIQAAKAGCHVLCEKPATFELDSFDRMAKACRENHVLFMVGQVVRWSPEFKAIKEYVDGGKLGNIHMIYEKRLCQYPSWGAWHGDPKMSGGGLYDLNVHDLDYLYTLFGRPDRVYASGWKSPTGCWNHVISTLTWKSGVKAVCESSEDMTGNFPFSVEFRGTGDAGTLHYTVTMGANINDSEHRSTLTWYPAGKQEAIPIQVEQTDMFVGEINAFLDAVKNGTEVPVTPAQVREVLEIVLAVKKSLETGEIVIL